MKKILLLSLCLLYSFYSSAQTEKGMLLMNGKVFSNSALSTNGRTNETNHFLSAQTEAGLFLNKRNLVGARLSFQLNDNHRKNLFTLEVEDNLDLLSELSSFYRFYPFPNRRLGLFGEMQLSILGDSQNTTVFYNQFKAQVGAGAYFFLRENLAFELSFAKPFYHSDGLFNAPNIVANIGLLGTFKRPVKTRLPRLEDTYLFVRNFYYGFGIQRSFNPIGQRNAQRLQVSLNAGFFFTSNWLVDFSYSFEDFGQDNGVDSFGDLRLESAFFIRLNKKGTYLRPSAGFKLETGSRIDRANPNLIGFQKSTYTGHLEIAQFIGDQLIFGGGTSLVMTRYDVLANHFQFNATVRLTYFVNQDFAFELIGNYYINDIFVNRTNVDLILELTSVNAELKVRHLLFQK